VCVEKPRDIRPGENLVLLGMWYRFHYFEKKTRKEITEKIEKVQ
jgi:hypothetical protein